MWKGEWKAVGIWIGLPILSLIAALVAIMCGDRLVVAERAVQHRSEKQAGK